MTHRFLLFNLLGTDPNRNFGYKWGVAGASSDPCHETYKGSSAFSEPETKALSDYIMSIKNRVKAYFAVHSYGQYWLYPWVRLFQIFYKTVTLQIIISYRKSKITLFVSIYRAIQVQ